jgi:hypothetical protein
MANLNEYRVLLVGDNGRWRDSQEGPWDTAESAINFADAEVGMPWVVVNGKYEAVAYGDNRGLREVTSIAI